MPQRRRSAVLRSLELFRSLHPGINLTQILAYLYIAENEGLSVTELSRAFHSTVATASRAARSLYDSSHPESLSPGLGLVEPRLDPSIPHARLLYLTVAGAALRDNVDDVVAAGVKIRIADAA